MPPKTKGKRIAKRRPYRKAGYRSKLAKSEFASMKETYEFAALPVTGAYVDYQNSLARNARASIVGRGYREYRITKMEYIFKPTLDTFAFNSGAIVPYLYAMVDRTGNLADFTTADQLRELGAKPRRLDDKIVRVSFKPSVLGYALDRGQQSNEFAKPMISPWLTTDNSNDTVPGGPGWTPSTVDHLGLAWIVDGNSTAANYIVEVVTHFQFRKPNLTILGPRLGADGQPMPPAKQAPAKDAPAV